ncbi:plasmid mobilization protein MobA [Leclercia adecarboxylata]|uniref:plasmid mobilization protein MobA n=1 Tax=Leclercia adecarboxylata TaxID=83655 RepID=UPI002949FFEA|nr:plasmid mobilization protein MobA [Leclercia adecarboxylata]MDV5280059.1 plasmid mobilization protein MobA [Leclercia adecarboxylata]
MCFVIPCTHDSQQHTHQLRPDTRVRSTHERQSIPKAKRQKTVIKTLRFTPDEIEQIEREAEQAGQSVSAFIRNAAMNRKVIPAIDDSFLTELLRLGRLQKHHFAEGKRVGIKEYSTVLVAITDFG